jgi:hypothetical protein
MSDGRIQEGNPVGAEGAGSPSVAPAFAFSYYYYFFTSPEGVDAVVV